MRSMNVHDVPLDHVGKFIDTYNLHGSKIDEELVKLKREEEEVYNEITSEKARIAKEHSSQSNGGLHGMQVSIGLFAEKEGEVEFELVYGLFRPV